MTKHDRLVHANAVIEEIARVGRRFFWCAKHNRISRFEIVAGRLWLFDKWTGKHVYVAYRGRWRHFSEGGTLQDLVRALANYIRTGEPISPRWFGPWPQWVCDGDLWGYGGAMAPLREKLATSPAVRPAR